MASILLALAFATIPLAGKTVAVVRPAALDGAPGWVSLAVADNVATALLDHSRTDAASGRREYPLAVFTWRESASAARAEGIDTSRPLSDGDAARLAHELGARYVLVASYRPKAPSSIAFKWRLVDVEARKPARDTTVTTNLATLSGRVDKLAGSVLRALGERPDKPAARASVPAAALTAYGRALEILAGQSLEPTARVVLPPIELKKVQGLCERATKAAPRFARAWVAMALASAMLGDSARAEQEVLRAVADTDDVEALDALGPYYLYVRQERPEDAIRALAEATTRRPGFLLGLGYLGSTYLRVGRARQAADVFATYEARVPKSPWAILMHARALAFAGDTAAAVAESRAVVAAFPGSSTAIAALGARLAQAGRYPEALDTLERGLAMHADDPTMLTKLAYVHLQLGHPEVALELAQRAIAKLGDGRGEQVAGNAYANLGQALALLGRKDEARAAFDKAATLGIGVEDRLLLLADARAKKALEEAQSPIVRDAPPPPAAAGNAAPSASASVSGAASATTSRSETASPPPRAETAATPPARGGSAVADAAEEPDADAGGDSLAADDGSAGGEDEVWAEDASDADEDASSADEPADGAAAAPARDGTAP